MSDTLFSLARTGDELAGQPALTPFAATLLPRPSFETTVDVMAGSRRRKLWEIASKNHCPLIGVCFDVEDLRRLMGKVMEFSRSTTDYVLHSTAVGACDTRSRLAELLQKQLEKRYQPTIRKFASAKTADDVYIHWRAACDSGDGIPGALWASWTHAACDQTLELQVYRDIHMIQHQIGSGTRADLAALQALKAENAQLHARLNETRHQLETQRSERAAETHTLGQRVVDLGSKLAGKDALVARLTAECDTLRQSIPDLKARQSLARRASDAEARALALTAKAAELEEEKDHHQRLIRHANETIQQLLAVTERLSGELEPAPTQTPATLSGKCILCVGGRTGSVDAYRREVEQRGGSFLHHDGGLEESLHRIDADLAAADLVICQAGCISHNAYWRVKEQCKRTGKQCIYIQGAGVSGFGRMVNTLTKAMA